MTSNIIDDNLPRRTIDDNPKSRALPEPIPPTTPARQNPNTLATDPYMISNTIDDPLTNATKITGINYNALPEPLRPANQQITDEDRAAQKMLEEDEQLRANEDMYLKQQIQRYNAGGGRTTGLNSVVSGPEPRYPEVASRRSDEPLPNNTISPDIMKALTQLLAYLKGA